MCVTSDSVLLLYLHRLIYLLTLCNAVTHRVCGNILGTLFFDQKVDFHAFQQHSDGWTRLSEFSGNLSRAECTIFAEQFEQVRGSVDYMASLRHRRRAAIPERP
jgi:hypothetical protein